MNIRWQVSIDLGIYYLFFLFLLGTTLSLKTSSLNDMWVMSVKVYTKYSCLKVIFYIWHSHYISGLVTEKVLASQAPICSLLIYNPERRQEAWRFLTYQFVHVNMEHIVFNTLMQVKYKVTTCLKYRLAFMLMSDDTIIFIDKVGFNGFQFQF